MTNLVLEMKTFSSNRRIFILLIWICCCSLCESARIIGWVMLLVSTFQENDLEDLLKERNIGSYLQL
jgi:hypothetical protein